jgi:hypothetical protein
MVKIHGKMLVRNFRQSMLDTYGLRIKVHQGFSMGQTADDGATLAVARSEQAETRGDSIVLDASMTVEQAEAAIRKVAGFAVQLLDASGANAPNDARLAAVGFKLAEASSSPAPASSSKSGGGAMAEISVAGQKHLVTLQAEFTRKFPRMGLMFFSLEEAKKAEQGVTIRPLPSNQTIASVRTKVAKGDMSIHGNTTVGTLESGFRDDYGLHVQVCVMRDGRPAYTGGRWDGISLSELDRRGVEQNWDEFRYPTA